MTAASAQSAITWDDLQASKTHLQNPYQHLTVEQTYRLSSLYQLKQWVEENQPKADSFEIRELRRIERSLAAEGLDSAALLTQVEAAEAYWRSQSQITNPELEGQSVQLSGYVLPLGEGKNKPEQVSEFLLVPYVGACIHVPPPPPNQMIYVKPAIAIDDPGLFSPVLATGQIRAQRASYELFRVDGSQTVEVSYQMDLQAITPDLNARSESIGSGDGWQNGSQNGQWWQALPTKISSILTQSLGNLQRQLSLSTLAGAMLMSFSYGVLHTLGPGHGKAVIASYFVGSGGSLQRGLAMGVRIAIFHVLSAVVIVLSTDALIQQVGGSSAGSYRIVQLVSYGAIALIGGWMLKQALQKPSSSHLSYPPPLGAAETLLYPSLSQQISEANQLEANQPPGCGCLTCDQRQSGWLAMAVGAVPCSGALLVLLYGLANDLLWPSVAMVVSISVGMACTLAWIGAIAIMGNRYGHQFAARYGEKLPKLFGKGQSRFSLAQTGQIIGASAVSLLGMGLFLLTLITSR
jgi:ABC-type nickel/cobalt efflux system permease component RcnA